jgi:hypothetical protein
MHQCREAQQADLLLDGHAWQFTTLREAVTTYRKLHTYQGAQWPDVSATMRRLFAEAPAAEQAWFHQEQVRRRSALASQTTAGPVTSRPTPKPSPRAGRQGRLLEDMPCVDRVGHTELGQ